MENGDINSNKRIVEELFRKYYKVLRAYAYRLLGDKDMAEDIVQDAYYELWKKQEQLIMQDAIKSYLFRSVYTKSLNCLNSKEYTEQESFEQSTEGKIQKMYIQSQLLDQESDLMYKELQTAINTIIDGLPDQCKKVFILSRKYELKNREIAERLDISLKTVEKHITKALFILRSNLKDSTGILLLPFFL
ncbi:MULTISPECIES: RNA polymerase sigma-70 factor [Parabacteroides]|uniref:RNA polymerase sigma-70 factor n=1 Tax=Parabacteroides leei TaxID=2939491 RepID=UPI00189A247A|nr:RNA polymerase sigma-70 factor [Parabacteroides goldsteinii]